MTMEILIGSDPEFFIKDNSTGKLISADGLFPGTKEEPFKVMHGAVQVDGMAAEFNILPAKSANEFILNHLSVLRSLRDIIKENNPSLDFSFVFDPVAEFGAEYIASQPEHARRLGCTPDYNAWENGAENPTPDADMPFRTASGHIHIGWGEDYDITDPEHIEACCMMAKQMDYRVGGMLLREEGKAGKKRRELYGKAGAFRPKSYGVEYRTSSNVWLRDTYYMEQVFTNTKRAFKELMGGTRWYESYTGMDGYINRHNMGSGELLSYLEKGWGDIKVDMDSLDKRFFSYIRYDTTGNYEKLNEEYKEYLSNLDEPAKEKKPKRAPWGRLQAFDDQPLVPAPAPAEWQDAEQQLRDLNILAG